MRIFKGSFSLKWVLVAYVALVLISHSWRALTLSSDLGIPLAGQEFAEFTTDHDGTSRDRVTVAYRDLRPPSQQDAPVLVLLHGSPVASRAMNGIIPLLSEGYRLIVPDLPGFGGSTRQLSDYSVRTHARYVIRLLERLGIERAHFFGYSRGGAITLNIADIAPERVQSITLASSVGVQEMELFGNFSLNRAVFFVQAGIVFFFQELFPQFGLLDNVLLDYGFARNFLDSDLRPLRGILLHYEKPVLIVHGEDDQLIPYATAIEHHRLVAQSELVTTSGGHLLLFFEPEIFAEPTLAFLERVERGEALTRAGADPDRLVASGEPFDRSAVPPARGIPLALTMIFIILVSWVTVDGVCIGAGLLAATGTIDLAPAIVASFLGIFSGDVLLYFSGRWFGTNLLYRWPFRWFLSRDAVEISESWFNRLGPILVIMSHFAPGTRFPTNFGSGVLRVKISRISLYFFVASALWSFVLVGLAFVLGGEIMRIFAVYELYAIPSFLFVCAMFYLFVHYGIPLCSYRGRRLLLSRWRRFSRWEFWPMWRFYPPIIGYVLYLGLRHRSLTLFTSTNPGMLAGGLVGENKSESLRALARGGDVVARWSLLKGDEPCKSRLHSLERFMTMENLRFPIVLKPDEGYRGLGVKIVHSRSEAERYLVNGRYDVIAQEYIGGYEYGIFYYRFPDEDKGRIFSITAKRFPTVWGDGERTLERLILDDDWAVCMAPLYLDLHRDELFRVPKKGERVQLPEIGSHCRGAIFMDGAKLISPALVRTIDEISRHHEGFYFGRYDVRVPSPQALMEGRNIKVLEVNGVTSAATHIYDPTSRLAYAYRTNFCQWRLAFVIGAQNRARGTRPWPLSDLINHYRAAMRRQRKIG